MMDVVAAFIPAGDRFLICRRPFGKKRGGLWELAGGKPEEGESAAEALARECREELDVDISVGETLGCVTYGYDDVTIRLTVLRASIVGGELKPLEHSDLRWIRAEDIGRYDFCPADELILDAIRALAAENGGRLDA